MKFRNLAYFFVLAIALVSWSSPNQEESLDKLVENKQFIIECEWAMPLVTTAMNRVGVILPPGSNVSRINLTGSGNILKVDMDSVSADLPYFGERQMGGGYSSDTGIEFDGVPKKISVKKNSKKGFYDIKFSLNKNAESFNVTLRMYPNLNANITINSSQRNSIRYDGKIKPIELDE